MLHSALIVLHAATATIAFVAGVLVLGVGSARSWRFPLYLWMLLGMAVFMLAAIVVAWPDLDRTTRLVFVGLSVLAAVMLARAVRARGRLVAQPDGWRPRYVDDIGFTLISLFDGFVIVAAIDLGLPAWLVVLVAVGGVGGGVLAMGRVKRRLAT